MRSSGGGSGQGLPNLGNTCYLNAALQSFLRSPGVLDALREASRLPQHQPEQQFSLTASLVNLASSFSAAAQEGKKKCLEDVMSSLEHKHSALVGKYLPDGLQQQFDSGFLLRSIVLPALQTEGAHSVAHLFTVSTARTLVNTTTGTKRMQLSPELCLNVSVAQPRTTIEEAIVNEVSVKTTGETQSSFAVDWLPRNVMISVDYHHKQGFLVPPVGKQVDLGSLYKTGCCQKYRLYGVVVHRGPTWGFGGGHYHVYLCSSLDSGGTSPPWPAGSGGGGDYLQQQQLEPTWTHYDDKYLKTACNRDVINVRPRVLLFSQCCPAQEEKKEEKKEEEEEEEKKEEEGEEDRGGSKEDDAENLDQMQLEQRPREQEAIREATDLQMHIDRLTRMLAAARSTIRYKDELISDYKLENHKLRRQLEGEQLPPLSLTTKKATEGDRGEDCTHSPSSSRVGKERKGKGYKKGKGHAESAPPVDLTDRAASTARN